MKAAGEGHLEELLRDLFLKISSHFYEVTFDDKARRLRRGAEADCNEVLLRKHAVQELIDGTIGFHKGVSVIHRSCQIRV